MHTVLRSRALRRSAALTAIASIAATAGVLIAPPAAAAPPLATSAGGCQSVTALTNGGFESPVIADNSYQIIPAASVPGWESTDAAGIELWGDGFYGVPAPAGRQFAELNATQSGTLFQEVATQPGQSLKWSLLHRGRGGVDTMDVLIGAPGGALVSQGALTDGTSAWGRHSGVYIVPAGQTVTRFGFRAVSTGSGDNSIGNFLDDISFGTGACVVVTSTVANVTVPGGAVHVGDTLEYTVTAHNQGGSPADLAELRDVLPAGVEFVPGSLRTAAGPLTGGKTDAAGDDQAEYDVATRTVVARLGAGAGAGSGGSIAAQESTTFVFRAVVTPAASLTQLSSAPTLDSTDSLSGMRTVSAAPVVVTPVAPTTDLVVTQFVDTPSPIAGGSALARFTVTVTNAGPQDDSGVVLRVLPLAGLAAASVILDGADCPVVGEFAECAVGSLPVGASRSAVVTGVVGQAVPAGTVIKSLGSATGDLYDRDTTNNAADAVATVAASSDVWVTAAAPVGPIRPGDDAAFEFTLGNDGPSDAAGIEVDVTAPEGATVTPSAGAFDATTGRWSIPALASGQRHTLVVAREATEVGTMRSRADVVAGMVNDPDRGNERAEAEIEVERIAVLVPPVTPPPRGPVPAPAPEPAPNAPAGEVAAAAPASIPAAVDPAVALARTGAQADQGLLLGAALSLAGLLLLIARRRTPARHRA